MNRSSSRYTCAYRHREAQLWVGLIWNLLSIVKLQIQRRIKRRKRKWKPKWSSRVLILYSDSLHECPIALLRMIEGSTQLPFKTSWDTARQALWQFPRVIETRSAAQTKDQDWVASSHCLHIMCSRLVKPLIISNSHFNIADLVLMLCSLTEQLWLPYASWKLPLYQFGQTVQGLI